jgi:tetratricopeptide (TPR) repeat protein
VNNTIILLISLYLSGAVLLCQELPSQEVRSPTPALGSVQDLPLNAEQRTNLQQALSTKDYTQAEDLLVKAVEANPKSTRLLTLLGGIFFLDGKYLNSAIALKRAEALAPLQDSHRFTLAMAYVVLDRKDWARPELERLHRTNPNNASYLYWLGRLDYDAQQFHAGIAKYQQVLKLDPKFMKAYDNLALCYEALGEHEQAIATYQKAIGLNRASSKPSPWPALNLGSLLAKLGRLEEARNYLKDSLDCDPKLAQAHYELGVVYEKEDKTPDAIQELNLAAALDPSYPDPHYSLGRIYRKLGEAKKAENALATFQKLKEEKRSERTQ